MDGAVNCEAHAMWTLLHAALTRIPYIAPVGLVAVLVFRLGYWLFLSLVDRPVNLGAYGSSSRRSWALITGASDGIGAAFAKELARHNFHLFLLGRNHAKLSAVEAEIRVEHPACQVVTLLSNASDASLDNVARVFEQVDATLATHRGLLRILINNVGMGQGGKRRLGDIPLREENHRLGDIFEEIVAVNCTYPVQLTRVFMRHLKTRAAVYNALPAGRDRVALFNVASCAGIITSTPFSSLYAGTKAFNRSFSLSLAGEMAAKRLFHPDTTPIVDVVCVNPGFVVSNMTKMSESFYCCSAAAHARVVFRKLAAWPAGLTADIVPHWKHGLMWAIPWVLEWLVPSEMLLTGVIMPAMIRLSGRFRNFKID